MEGAAGAQGLGLKQGFWRAPGADALQGTQKGRNDGDVSTVAPLLPYSANPAAKPSKGHTYMRDVSSWSYLEASSPVRELVLYRLPPTSRPGTPSWAADMDADGTLDRAYATRLRDAHEPARYLASGVEPPTWPLCHHVMTASARRRSAHGSVHAVTYTARTTLTAYPRLGWQSSGDPMEMSMWKILIGSAMRIRVRK